MEPTVCHQQEGCLVCSDSATPGRVLTLVDHSLAKVDTGNAIIEVCLDLVDAQVGDIVLVHAGVALRTLPDTDTVLPTP